MTEKEMDMLFDEFCERGKTKFPKDLQDAWDDITQAIEDYMGLYSRKMFEDMARFFEARREQQKGETQ